MSEEIKIVTPDNTTIQKVESFLGCVNREIEKCIDNHRQNEQRTEDRITCVIAAFSILFSAFVLILIRTCNKDLFHSLDTVICVGITFAGAVVVFISFLIGADMWRVRKRKRETETNRNRIAGEDIKKVLDELAKTHSLKYTWRGTQIDKNGEVVTDWNPPYEGTYFGRPEHLIQTIFCDGILFVSARYWRPIPIFPDDDITRNEKVVRISHQKVPYVELWDRCVTLKTIPLDPDTDQLSILQKDHRNWKFLPIEADEEMVNYLVNRISR